MGGAWRPGFSARWLSVFKFSTFLSLGCPGGVGESGVLGPEASGLLVLGSYHRYSLQVQAGGASLSPGKVLSAF